MFGGFFLLFLFCLFSQYAINMSFRADTYTYLAKLHVYGERGEVRVGTEVT